ncbi:Crp/Fnr family transcriptional regulator [Streptomyces sp. NPDC005492]|uniref:Crp/Fnr family transcriptional regulator n=1 Tax=Streptomyces sp. NPDC005492 TaxID=3156883 RepID=UPI0033A0E1E1
MPSTVVIPRPADLLLGHENKPEGSFLHRLKAEDWPALLALLQSELDASGFVRDQCLPLGPEGRDVYIIWDGVVRQDRFPLGRGEHVPTVTRFRGRGQLVGEAKLITPDSAVVTKCLTPTVAIPCRARHLNVLLRRRQDIQVALLCSLEERSRSDELVYTMATRPPVERVSRLLAHLADTTGVPDPRTGWTVITGPGQKDIAASLQIAVSTVENAVRTLRYQGVIEARYRQFVVHDVDELRHFHAGSPA